MVLVSLSSVVDQTNLCTVEKGPFTPGLLGMDSCSLSLGKEFYSQCDSVNKNALFKKIKND